jgi:hypothetical protein
LIIVNQSDNRKDKTNSPHNHSLHASSLSEEKHEINHKRI